MKAILIKLNKLPRLEGEGRRLRRADLLSLDEAIALTGYSSLCNPSIWRKDSVFVKVSVIVELYNSLEDAGRLALANDELIGGWFAECDGDGDDDGNFCSTLSHCDELPDGEDFAEDAEHAMIECHQDDPSEGILFFY